MNKELLRCHGRFTLLLFLYTFSTIVLNFPLILIVIGIFIGEYFDELKKISGGLEDE